VGHILSLKSVKTLYIHPASHTGGMQGLYAPGCRTIIYNHRIRYAFILYIRRTNMRKDDSLYMKMDPEIKRALNVYAAKEGESIKAIIDKLIKQLLEQEK
jgi:hypothetical protein